MKIKVHNDRDDARVAGRIETVVETDEDCQLAKDRIDTLRSSAKDERSHPEIESLNKAIENWQSRKGSA